MDKANLIVALQSVPQKKPQDVDMLDHGINGGRVARKLAEKIRSMVPWRRTLQFLPSCE